MVFGSKVAFFSIALFIYIKDSFVEKLNLSFGNFNYLNDNNYYFYFILLFSYNLIFI